MTHQRSFEELGTPLATVTFCVIDLETTGGSPDDCGITEVGAAKVQGGEIVGTFHTLVDPGCPVPAFIRLLTGITDETLVDAPEISAVLPSLLSFVGDSVIVAHNARFDVGFLNAALRRHAYPSLTNTVVDTAILARKILAGEVPNNRLGTLADHFRCAHRPSHRAFADVLATVDVLHNLIERVAGFGVTTLEDLRSVSSTRMDGTFAKISLTESLPRGLGVYRFIGPNNNTLYVGKATDIRSRVRSYFYGDPRRKIRDLLRETQSMEARLYPTLLEAEVAEARAIAKEQPPYNRAGKRARSWYLKVDITAKVPRLAPARAPKSGPLFLGPLPSMKVVRSLMDAARDAAHIHRCTDPAKCASCPASGIGTCAGASGDAQRGEVRVIASAVAGDARPALETIAARMLKLARSERFEEAAEVRERGALLERHLARYLAARSLVDAGDIVLMIDRRAVLIRDAQLAAALHVGPGGEHAAVERLRAAAPPARRLPYLSEAQQRDAAVIASWLRRRAEDVRILWVQGPWVSPAAAAPTPLFRISNDNRTETKGPPRRAAR